MKPFTLILMWLSLLGLISCQSPPPKAPPKTADKVDVARYLGRWHEIARLPMPFQQENEAAIAEYGRNADGSVSVRNIGVQPDGTTREVHGYAKVLNPGTNTKLLVRFTEWFAVFIPKPEEGNYWILHVDKDYRHAVVGTPDRRYLWILSRSSSIQEKDLEQLKAIAREQGYDVSRLFRSAQHKPKEQG